SVTPSWVWHLSCLITVNPADSSGCVTLLSSLSSPSSLAHKENIYPQGLLRAPAGGVSMEIVSRVDGCVCVCVCVYWGGVVGYWWWQQKDPSLLSGFMIGPITGEK